MKRFGIKRWHSIGKNDFTHHAVAFEIREPLGRIPVFTFLFPYVLFCRIFIAAAPSIKIWLVTLFEIIPIGLNRSTGVGVGGNNNIGFIAHGMASVCNSLSSWASACSSRAAWEASVAR